jgi:hypothetical protein
MKDWHHQLPPEVLDMLRMSHDELNDFAGTVARMEALSKISFRRAVEAVAQEQTDEASDVWAADPDKQWEALKFREQKVQQRMALAISAHKELIKAKYNRLDALDKYNKAQDAPKPALIQFTAKMPEPRESVQRLINMGRLEEAKKQAKVYQIEHEFDFSDVG